MRDNFIITVTNNIEGCPIEKYLESICANVVIGTNIFSDIAASFYDFFGGHSGSYKSKLELIYNEASKELKKKAIKLGANAIVGFSVDFDEISGQGKSMFMISASGTACVVKYQSKENQQDNLDTISQEILDTELKKRLIIKLINEGASIQGNWREFLYEHPQKDIVKRLLDIYVADCFSNYETDKEIIAFIERHFNLLPKADFIDNVYSRYIENSKEICNLIKACHLFSPSHVLNIAKNDAHLAISLLEAKKDFYKKEDLDLMKQIMTTFESLPNTGRIEMVKGGLLIKDQEKFICENGHKNSKDTEFCDTCGRNIKGLHKDEVELITQFKAKIEVLSDFLQK
ncbi:MAG: YbjQ family protein [Bacteroidaceae bacterium]|nr:YbjQ family protein [Bacteroidaceae bacterium]